MLHCHEGKADCSDVLYIFSVRMSVYHGRVYVGWGHEYVGWGEVGGQGFPSDTKVGNGQEGCCTSTNSRLHGIIVSCK